MSVSSYRADRPIGYPLADRSAVLEGALPLAADGEHIALLHVDLDVGEADPGLTDDQDDRPGRQLLDVHGRTC